MEQFIGLIIFFVAWIIISAMKKAAKKQQEAAQQLRKNAQMQNQQASRPASTADEINKLIEMFTGEYSTPQPTPVTATPENTYAGTVETIESTVEAGGIETSAPTYRSVEEYVPYTSSIDDFTSEDNLQTVLAEKPENEIVINRSKNLPNPFLSDFDLKKAVIYSAILEPKYFWGWKIFSTIEKKISLKK